MDEIDWSWLKGKVQIRRFFFSTFCLLDTRWTFDMIIYSLRNRFGCGMLGIGTLRWTLKVLRKAEVIYTLSLVTFSRRLGIKSRANLLLAIYREIDFTKLALNDFPAVTRFSQPPPFCQFIYLSELVRHLRVMGPKIYVFNKNEYQDYYETRHAQVGVSEAAFHSQRLKAQPWTFIKSDRHVKSIR